MHTNITLEQPLNNTELSVLKLLMKNPHYLRAEFAGIISKTSRTVQRTLVSLKGKGLIKRVASKKDGK